MALPQDALTVTDSQNGVSLTVWYDRSDGSHDTYGYTIHEAAPSTYQFYAGADLRIPNATTTKRGHAAEAMKSLASFLDAYAEAIEWDAALLPPGVPLSEVENADLFPGLDNHLTVEVLRDLVWTVRDLLGDNDE